MVIIIAFVGLGIVIGIIKGIVDLIKTPKPPVGSSSQDIKWWYAGGWKVAQREEELRRLIEEAEENLHNRIRDYLKSGEKMEAIKEYKDFHECSLSKAKTAISEIEWEIEYERSHYNCEMETARGKRNVISSIDGMEGHQFEYFCADLLFKVGFINVNVTPGSGDQGVDILAEKDGVRYAIQCKNYSTPLGNTPVQEVNAGKTFYNCHVGVVMTNSTFTQGAETLARATGVLLWNRVHLERLMEQAGVQLVDEDDYIPENDESRLADEPIDFDDNDFVREVAYVAEKVLPERVAKPRRKGMQIWAIVCYVFAIIYGILSTIVMTEMIAACILFAVLGVMFSVIKRTPKGSPYILGATSGIKTEMFVLLCIVAAFVLPVIVVIAIGVSSLVHNGHWIEPQ